MTHTLNDYKIYTVNSKVISDFVLYKRLTDLNYANFTSPVYISSGTEIVIKYLDIDEVFTGKVTQCRKVARTVNDIAQYEIEAVELAEELTNIYITDTTYTGLYINNVKKTKTLGDFVGHIINGTEWSDVSDYTYKSTTIVSGGASEDAIPSMGFSTCTVWTALQRLIVTIFNYGLWFEYPAGNKALRYGEFNKEIQSGEYPTPINITMQENSTNYNIDGIVVYGADPSLYHYYGDISKGGKVVAYKYMGCNSMEELKWVAKKVYEDRSTPRIRYEIEFPAGYYKVNEGDRIHIYDTSVNLAYNKEGYGVKDVQIRDDKTIVGIGSTDLTIFDILNDRLNVIDGGILSYAPVEFESDGYINVFASQDAPEAYGEESIDTFDITGETFLGDFYLAPAFSALRQEGEGYFTIYSAVGSASNIGIELGTPAEILFGASTETVLDYYPIFEESWFPWSWEWVEILVEYSFSGINPSGVGLTWNCTWPNVNVLGAECTKYSSSNQNTITHRWYVPQMESVEYSYPTITATAVTGSVILTNLDITLNVYYNETSIVHPSASLETGDLQMKVQQRDDTESEYYDLSDWITIYDASDPDSYIGATYDMNDYISYNIVEAGEGLHKFVYKCKGDHTAPEVTSVGIAVKMYGTYASFNEKTVIK